MAVPVVLDAELLTSIAAEVRPDVERATGRRLQELPAVRLVDDVSAETLTARIAEASRIPPAYAKELVETSADVLDRAIAFYEPLSTGIWVRPDAVRRALATALVPDAQVRPFLGCILAHELTHAVQDQYVVDPDADPGQVEARTWIAEGHATLVASRVCLARYGPEVAARFDAVSGPLDPAAVAGAPGAQAYVNGRLYVAAIEQSEGSDGVWRALAHPPPVEVQVAVGEELLPREWRDPRPLLDAFPWFGDPGAEAVIAAPMGGGWLVHAAPALDAQPGGSVPRVTLALGAARDAPRPSVALVVQLETPEEAARWMDSRAERARTEQARVRVPAPNRVHIEVRRGDRYDVEAWAAEGHLLVGGVVWDGERSDARAADAGVDTLLATFRSTPEREAALERLRRAVSGTGVVPPTEASPTWGWRLRRALGGDPTRCDLDLADLMLAPPEPWVVDLGIWCASLRDDSVAADALLVRHGATGRPPNLLVWVAAGRLVREDLIGAHELLAVVRAGPGPFPDGFGEFWGTTLVELRRNEELSAEVRNGVVPAGFAVDAGIQAIQRGRYASAFALFSAACPRLGGAERTSCERLRASVAP